MDSFEREFKTYILRKHPKSTIIKLYFAKIGMPDFLYVAENKVFYLIEIKGSVKRIPFRKSMLSSEQLDFLSLHPNSFVAFKSPKFKKWIYYAFTPTKEPVEILPDFNG